MGTYCLRWFAIISLPIKPLRLKPSWEVESSLPISKARKSGASIANGHWLLFIDADTYPRPGLLAAMPDLIESGM